MKESAGRVSLTFDDGPNGEYTLQILDILEKHGVKVAFFFPAKNIERLPEIAVKAKEQGHVIGSHTYDHPHLNNLSLKQVLWQIERTEQVFKDVLDIKPVYFRPPYGEYSKSIEDIIYKKGYKLILWDSECCPVDWKSPPIEDIVDIVVNKAGDGSIILLHDGRNTKIGEPRQNTVDALARIIPILFEKGFEIVSLDKLCKEKERQ